MSRSMKERKPSQEWGFMSDFRSSSGKDEVCWLTKYRPQRRSDLALHKRKVDNVASVLTDALTHKRHKVVILSGPSGTGKSATVRALANDMKYSIEEWVNPIMTYEQGVYYESEVSKFKSFLLSSSRYKSLFNDSKTPGNISTDTRKIVLLEELPTFALSRSAEFWEILQTYSRCGLYPVVLIVSDTTTNIRIPLEYVNISFNPIAVTFMTRALKKICESEKLSEADLPDIIAQADGDLRNAILSLRFNGSTREKGSKRRKIEGKETKMKTCKDDTLFIFHALGKLLYAKRHADTPLDCADSKLGRRQLEFVPESVAEKCNWSSDLLTQFLHHNYLGFHTDIESVLLVSDTMCESDTITNHWVDGDVSAKLQAYAMSLTTRAVAFAKDPEHVPKFTPICRPVQRDTQTTCTTNTDQCREAFALQHTGANSCFIVDTLPYLKKIGYKPTSTQQYTVLQNMSHFATSSKSGVCLGNKEVPADLEDPDSISTPRDMASTRKWDRADKDDHHDNAYLAMSRELDAEIEDFSD